MTDPTDRRWLGAGGLFLIPICLTQSLCTAGVFEKRNPVNERLHFLIVAHEFQSALFLLLCSWFIHCKENTLCNVQAKKTLLGKKKTVYNGGLSYGSLQITNYKHTEDLR